MDLYRDYCPRFNKAAGTNRWLHKEGQLPALTLEYRNKCISFKARIYSEIREGSKEISFINVTQDQERLYYIDDNICNAAIILITTEAMP
jgi:hypothetical protein